MEKEKVTPQQVMNMLRKEGRVVTIEQAELILDFLRKMAKAVVSEYLTNDKIYSKINQNEI